MEKDTSIRPPLGRMCEWAKCLSTNEGASMACRQCLETDRNRRRGLTSSLVSISEIISSGNEKLTIWEEEEERFFPFVFLYIVCFFPIATYDELKLLVFLYTEFDGVCFPWGSSKRFLHI